MKSKYDNWHTSPFLKWDRRHFEALEKLVILGIFSTQKRGISFLRGKALNPIPILNYYLANHDRYWLRKHLVESEV